MPGRNIIKVDAVDSYYHVYARGLNKQEIFLDESDFAFFLYLLKRYLSHTNVTSNRGVAYVKLYDDVQVLSYCLMPNHFHLLIYQVNERAMTKLMRCVLTSYSQYFNRRYRRSGPLFGSCYRASRVGSEHYLLHITRYIHLNPLAWRTYNYSSLKYYLGDVVAPDWIDMTRIMKLYDSRAEYLTFLEDYLEKHDEIDVLKHQLAI